uniref:Zinc ABC transporter substrate-binding protein n=1 Tax=Eiseniibacteriota bacterium TaxID=2212470 RepID=A0A832HZQ4_UNCEI
MGIRFVRLPSPRRAAAAGGRAPSAPRGGACAAAARCAARALIAACAAAASGAAAPAEAARLRVAASTTDLASIAASVGGGRIEAFAIARPTADVHRVEALPSHMVRVSRARVYLKVGLGLDQWADAVIDGSRNARLEVVDCSRGVRVLEKPAGRVDYAMGDVHPGNPHYWLDPRNGAVVARTVAEALARVDPEGAAGYRARAAEFAEACAAAWTRERAHAEAMGIRTVFTYHRSWTYFADAFGFEIAGTVEPVPGIPPTARHLASLVEVARRRGVPVLIREPYFSGEAGRFLARQAGVREVIAAASCADAAPGSYLAHIDAVLAAIDPASAGKGHP